MISNGFMCKLLYVQTVYFVRIWYYVNQVVTDTFTPLTYFDFSMWNTDPINVVLCINFC